MLKSPATRSALRGLGSQRLALKLGRGAVCRGLHMTEAGVSLVTPALNGRLRDDASYLTVDHMKSTAPLIDHNPVASASLSSSELVRSLDKIKSCLAVLANGSSHHKNLIAFMDTLLSTLQHPYRPLKVAVIPWGCTKGEITDVTDSLLVDPTAVAHHWVQPYLADKSLRAEGHRLLINFAESANIVPSCQLSSVMEISLPSPLLAPKSPTGASRGIQILELNSAEDLKISGLGDCHLRIFVTNNPTSLVSPLPESYIPSQVVLLAKGLENFHRRSTGSQGSPIILSSSSSAMASFGPLSNIESLKTIIQLHTQSLAPLLRDVNEAVKTTMALDKLYSMIKTEDERIRSLIKNWAIDSNKELHQSLIPGLTKLTRSKIPWWKLYFYLGDMSHVANQTQETLNEYFFAHSRPRIGYIAGSIDEFGVWGTNSNQPITTGASAEDYFAITRRRILREQIPQLQQQARDQLRNIVVGTQLPLATVAGLGVYFYDYTFYTMGSIAALGLIVGFKHLQNKWIQLTEEFNYSVVEQAQMSIEAYETDLVSKWNTKQTNILQQVQALDDAGQDYQRCVSECESRQLPEK